MITNQANVGTLAARPAQWTEVRCGSIASVLPCPQYVRFAGDSGNASLPFSDFYQDVILRSLYYAASAMIYVPTSLSQEVGAALGTQAGEAKLCELISKGGFTRIRRATETPFNMILEARP